MFKFHTWVLLPFSFDSSHTAQLQQEPRLTPWLAQPGRVLPFCAGNTAEDFLFHENWKPCRGTCTVGASVLTRSAGLAIPGAQTSTPLALRSSFQRPIKCYLNCHSRCRHFTSQHPHWTLLFKALILFEALIAYSTGFSSSLPT